MDEEWVWVDFSWPYLVLHLDRGAVQNMEEGCGMGMGWFLLTLVLHLDRRTVQNTEEGCGMGMDWVLLTLVLHLGKKIVQNRDDGEVTVRDGVHNRTTSRGYL